MPRSHRVIARQLRKSGLDPESSPELQAFLGLVKASYDEFEKHRQLTDHSTRLASEELAETIASLGSSERLFRSLARCSPNGIIHTDTAGRCLYTNKRVQELTGRSADELAGSGWLQSLRPEDRELFYATAAELGPDADQTIEHRVILDNGDEIWASTVVASLRDAEDNMVGWVANIEDVTERKMHEHELSLLARHDSLTQLLNRHALRQRLDELFESRTATSRVAIALIDLDRFKLVNDTFGHEVGDNLLVVVADILRAAVGEQDIVARLGGDEFALAMVLEEGRSPEALGAALAEALQGTVAIGSSAVHLGASVGVAVADGRNGTPASLLHAADMAMYRAKRSADESYEVCDTTPSESVKCNRVQDNDGPDYALTPT